MYYTCILHQFAHTCNYMYNVDKVTKVYYIHKVCQPDITSQFTYSVPACNNNKSIYIHKVCQPAITTSLFTYTKCASLL